MKPPLNHTPYSPWQDRRGFLWSLLASLLMVFIFTLFPAAMQAGNGNGTVVIFSASWCASCRSVVPAIRSVSEEQGFPVVEIDVDQQDAPKQASRFGLSVPTGDPPQVFLVRGSQSTQLFDGSKYRFGTGVDVRSTILQKLPH